MDENLSRAEKARLRYEERMKDPQPEVIDAVPVEAEEEVPEPTRTFINSRTKRGKFQFKMPKFALPNVKFGNPFKRRPKDDDDQEQEEPKENIFGRLFKSRSVKIGAGFVVALVILIVIISIVGIPQGPAPVPYYEMPGTTTASPSTEAAPLFTPPQAPKTLLPVDLASAAWFSPTQVIIVLSFLLLGFANYRDAKQRGQVSDFMATVIGFLMIVSASFVASLLKGPLGWLGLTDFQLLYFTSVAVSVYAITKVWEVSRQGGVDFTPLGDFITSIAGWALLFGSLGAVGVILNTPKSPVLPLYQVEVLFVLKQYEQIWMSLTVYGLLLLGVVIYGLEILRMSRTLNAKEMTGTILTSFVGLVAYPSIRIFAGWSPIQTFLGALALASLTGLVAVRAGAVSPLTTGETRTSNAVTIPWDKLAFQLAAGLLMITLLGKV